MREDSIRFLSLYGQKASVSSGLLFSPFPVRVLKWLLSAMKCMLRGSFSHCCGLSSWIDMTQCTSLSLSQHELHIFWGETSFIWMSDIPARATCSEFRSCILERIFFPLGYVDSLRFVIKTCLVGSIIC